MSRENSRNIFNVIVTALVLIALGLAGPVGVRADTPYTDYFTSAPFSGYPTSFSTGSSSVGLDYVCESDGNGCNFAYNATGGDGGSAMVDISSLGYNTSTTEMVTITSRDGQAFYFVSMWVGNTGGGTAMTISGYGAQPFTINVSQGASGTYSPAAGNRLVDRVEITSTDFYFSAFDTVSTIVAYTPADNDGDLTASGTVVEPVALPSTANAAGSAVDVFDFDIVDGGTSDGLALDVSQVVLHTSGTGDFSKVVWRLDGPDASNVTGVYSAGGNTITFSGLGISVADGASETYTVNAYYSDNTGLTEGQTYVLSVDGDTDLTVGGSGTQMGTTSPVNNGAGSPVDITATALVFATQPGDTQTGAAIASFTVEARDAAGNLDSSDSSTAVTLSFDANPGGSTISGTNPRTVSSGVATFDDISLDQDGIGYAFDADGGGLTTATSDPFDIIDPEPTNHPTGFSATANSVSQITTAWTDSSGGTTPDGYLVLCNLTGSFTPPVDGSPQSNDAGCSGGNGAMNVAQGVGTYSWTGLDSDTQYYFTIYPYTNSGANIDYKTDGPPTDDATTPKDEPTNYPVGFSATADSANQITTAWTDSSGGTLPDGYLVLCNDSGTFTPPADGTPQSDDADCSDGSGALNVAQGVGAYSWTGFDSNTHRYYTLFPYTNSGASIDYKTDGAPPTDDATTSAPDLSINDVTVSEGAGAATFTVTLSSASALDVGVDYATSDGTASVAGGDYAAASGHLTVTAGSLTSNVVVTVNDDTLDENSETFSVTLSAPVNATIADEEGIGTITDDDAPPTLSINDALVNEGAGTATFTVTLSAASGLDVAVDYATYDGTAQAPGDYTAIATTTLDILAGATTGNVVVSINDDALDETLESFYVHLGDPVNATLADGEGQGTIIDNDGVPDLLINDVTVGEGAGTAVFIVTLSNVSVEDVGVDYATSDGTASVAGGDYVAVSEHLTVTAGNLTGNIVVSVNDDALDENSETFSVTLSAPVNATIADGEGIGTITDNDEPPALSINNATVDEGAGAATFTVSLSTASGLAVAVDYVTSDGTATAGSDYTALPTTTLIITAGSTTGNLAVTILEDVLAEDSETFNVTLSNPVSAVIADGTGVCIITDNDIPGVTITESGGSTDVAEGGGTDSYEVVLDTQPSAVVTITVTPDTQVELRGGTSVLLSLAFTPDNWDTAQTVTVAAVDDDVVEGLHTGTVTHSASSSDGDYHGLSISGVSVNITDNDTAPGTPGVTITESGGSTDVAEGGSTDSYAVVLDTQPSAVVTITLSPDAQAVVTPTTLVFTPDDWDTAQTVSVAAVDDDVVEGLHTGTVTHSASSSDGDYHGISISDVSVNITDNDQAFFVYLPLVVRHGASSAAQASSWPARRSDLSHRR